MRLLIPLVLAVLAVMSVTATAPPARAVTIDHLTITVTANGQTSTATFQIVDLNGAGVITVPVSSSTLSRIQSAFGTTTFAFPGSFTGTFTFGTTTLTVTISSTDNFMLIFTQAP